MLIFLKYALQIAVLGSFGPDVDQNQMTSSRPFMKQIFKK